MIYEPGFYKSEELFDGSPYYIYVIRKINERQHEYIIKVPTYGVEYKESGDQISHLFLYEVDFNKYRLRKNFARKAIQAIFTGDLS